MGLSLKFKCSSMFTGGQPLIQEQGHPHQVLSMETRPICTPPASLSARLQPGYIFTAFSQSCPQNPPAQASCGDSPSTTGAGALFSSGSGGGLTSPPAPQQKPCTHCQLPALPRQRRGCLCPSAVGCSQSSSRLQFPIYRQDLAPGYRSCCFWQPTSGFAARQ